jgi:hypothetical protein
LNLLSRVRNQYPGEPALGFEPMTCRLQISCFAKPVKLRRNAAIILARYFHQTRTPTSASHRNPTGFIQILDFAGAIRDDRVWTRVSSASITSSFVKSRRTEPLCRRWSNFEHCVVSAETRPFAKKKIGFSAKPRCDGHMRRHLLQRINLHSHNSASQGQQPTRWELIGEGAPPVFGRPQGDWAQIRKQINALTQNRPFSHGSFPAKNSTPAASF